LLLARPYVAGAVDPRLRQTEVPDSHQIDVASRPAPDEHDTVLHPSAARRAAVASVPASLIKAVDMHLLARRVVGVARRTRVVAPGACAHLYDVRA